MRRRELNDVSIFWRAAVHKINEISDMSDHEFVSIVTSMEIMNNKNFQCAYCMGKANEARRKQFGCREEKNKPVPIQHYGTTINFFRCPGNFYDQTVESLLYIQQKYESGSLPFGGFLMDQPNRFIQMMNLIDCVKTRMLSEKVKK